MSNRSLTLLSFALIFSCIYATATGFGKAPERKALKIEKTLNPTLVLGTPAAQEMSGCAQKSKPRHSAPLTDVISDPEGEEVFYDKVSYGTFVLGNQMSMYEDSFPATIVWGADNAVYFKNFLSVFPDDYYLKGELKGNTIVMKTNQTIEYYEEEGYGINFGVFKTVPGVQNGQEVVFFEYASDVEQIEFIVAKDGSIEMKLPGEPFDGENPSEYVAGFYFTDDYSFTGYCDFYQKYTKRDIEFISIPKGLEIIPYVYIDEFNYASIVDVAFDNDKGYLYIRGLNSMLPEGTIRAKIEGDKAIVAQNEYLGIYFDQFYILTKVMYENPDYDENDEDSAPMIPAPSNVGFELNIDKDLSRIYADKEGVYLSFHCNENDYLNSLGYYGIFELLFQDSFEGTPANPSSLEYTTEYAPYQGFNDFFFTLSNHSTDGKLLDTEYMYYKVFVDGDPLVFCEEEAYNLLNKKVVIYEGVPIQVELIPYGFNNNNDIFKFSDNIFDVGIYLEGITTIGVQTVYFYNQVFTYSDIVTLNVETGDVEVLPGDSGVEYRQDREVESTEYYCLDGFRLNRPQKGMNIKVTRYTDGSVSTEKVIVR